MATKRERRRIKPGQCVAAGCDRESETIAGLCKRCYGWMKYWQHRSPAELTERQSQIDFWQKRIAWRLGGGRAVQQVSKVIPFKKRA